jgi:peroxiredoxin
MMKSFSIKTVWGVLLMLLFAPPAFAALKLHDTAPAFSLPDRENKEFSLTGACRESKNKDHGVVLSFFASWCLICRNELPILNSVVDELSIRGIKVVIVGVKEDFVKIEAFLKELKVDKPMVLSDREGTVTRMYQVRFLPTIFFIDCDGKVRDMIFGEVDDAEELRKSAAKLMK